MRHLVALAFVHFALTRLYTVGLTYDLDDRGVVSFSDGEPLVRAVVGVHAPGWAYSSNEQPVTVRREGDRVHGSLTLPAPCHGGLAYTVSAAAETGTVTVSYTAELSRRNDIEGAQVSFFLPTNRFEGKVAMLLPGGARRALPARGEPLGLSGTAAAFAVEVGDGNSLVIAGDSLGSFGVQDNRQWGADVYEVRARLLGPGRVVPCMVARRTFRVAILPSTEVSRFVEAVCPTPMYEPTRPFALLRSDGRIVIGTLDGEWVRIGLYVHGVGWSYSDQASGSAQFSGDSRTRFVTGTVPVPPGTGRNMEYVEAASAREDGSLGLRYHLHFPEAVRLNGYQVSFHLDLAHYAGQPISLETPEGPRDLVIPTKHGENFLFSGLATGVMVAPGEPKGFSLTADQPSSLLIQDNRGWGGNDIELRFNFRRQELGEEVPAGETVEREFIFRLNGPLQVILDEGTATTSTDTRDWIPYSLPWDSCPVDVSFLNHKPAGSRGFVTVRDGRFILSDTGEEIRFWGTCFSAGANFPTHEQAELIARRLARFGVNMVRTHHADADWSERCFFDKSADHTRSFDPESLDRFDYLIYCLKREGIYIYLDQLVNRSFKAGDGVDAADQLGPCAKPYSNFDPRLIELQKEFSRALWTHVNPYTGLAYKDDPAIALMEFANENDLFAMSVTLEPYRTRFEAMYREWAARNHVVLPEGPINFAERTDDLMRFLVEVQRNYYLEMRRFLREEVGVRIPMTGSNWSINAALLAALQDMDYTDSHAYWHHPAGDGSVGNTPMLASPVPFFGGLAFQRMVGKPFFVSEWDEPWPNEWRAELPCWMSAVAAFQGWNGLTVYTYRHSSAVPIDWLSGAFETFNDPARFGLFPAAALMFRRGDVDGARQRTAIVIPEELVATSRSATAWSIPALRAGPELHRLETALYQPPQGFDRVLEAPEPDEAAQDARASDTGQIWRSITQRLVRIDSPRSQAVLGFLSAAGEQSTSDMTVACESSFATVALSSLTGLPIAQSDRLLLTAVGRAENTGFRWNVLRNKAVSAGTGPILVDPIRARISIRTIHPDLRVWAIAADGTRSGEVPSWYEQGRLVFDIGPQGRTIYYGIDVE